MRVIKISIYSLEHERFTESVWWEYIGKAFNINMALALAGMMNTNWLTALFWYFCRHTLNIQTWYFFFISIKYVRLVEDSLRQFYRLQDSSVASLYRKFPHGVVWFRIGYWIVDWIGLEWSKNSPLCGVELGIGLDFMKRWHNSISKSQAGKIHTYHRVHHNDCHAIHHSIP